MFFKTTCRFLTTLLCITPLLGEKNSLISPISESNTTLTAKADDAILIKKLKGVLLVPNQASVERLGVNVNGFDAQNMDVPGGLKKLNHKLGSQFIGLPLTINTIMELKRQIILYYRDQGFPVVTVEVPEQSMRKGVVQLIVIEAKMGEVIIQGNKYFSTNILKGYLLQQQGKPIASADLLNDIAWINRNPFRHADVFFTPGATENTTDIEVIIKDQWPFQVYAGGDNTGLSPIGDARWFTGFNWGNAFWLDHILSYQFSMSTDYRRFWAHTFNYNAPLSWRHVLLVYGGFSHIHPDITGYKSTGHSSQASLRYQIPFKPIYNSFIQELTLGFDFKNTNNNLFFSETVTVPVVTHAVNITQLYSGYSLGKSTDTNEVAFNVEGFWSPGKWIGDQQNRDFAGLHPGAKNHYVYGRLTLADTWKFTHGYSLLTQFRGQVSNQNLVPSEQFGLGGYNTVRGYEEREVNYDDAICFNIELRFPSTRLLWFMKNPKDDLQFLAFFDYGTGRNAFQEFDEPQWQHLIGIGPGFRYKINKYLSMRLDWGFKLHKTEFSHIGSKVHVGVIASY